MKKILLIVAIVFLIFQMFVLAVTIDIGAPAIVRSSGLDSLYLTVNATNPANAAGKIFSIEIYVHPGLGTLESVRVGTFYVVSGDNLSTRDYQIIGNVPEGKHIYSVDLDVQAGDFIGMRSQVPSSNGKISYAASGFAGLYLAYHGEIPCTNLAFTFYSGDVVSLYGTGIAFPAQVTGVSATDGDHTNKVRVTWNAASGADRYYVWQGSSWVNVGLVTAYDHTGAPAPTITHGSVTASDGDPATHVVLSNTGASANNGSSISYKVKAWNTVGYGAESASNSGYRGVGTLTYQWYRSAGDSDASYSSISGANTASYNDTGAPAPTITAGTASASDETSRDYVTLSIAGESANIGAGRYYKCYHTATGATPGYTGVNRGYRGVGALTYQWQRSAADSDADYSNIDGATTDPYNDTEAPVNGNGRYYKCVENATGASQQITNSDRGYRLAWFHKWNTKTIAKWNTKIFIKWNELE